MRRAVRRRELRACRRRRWPPRLWNSVAVTPRPQSARTNRVQYGSPARVVMIRNMRKIPQAHGAQLRIVQEEEERNPRRALRQPRSPVRPQHRPACGVEAESGLPPAICVGDPQL